MPEGEIEGSVADSAETSGAAPVQQEAPAQTVASTPATSEQPTEAKTKEEKPIADAQQNTEETVRRLLEPHKATLEQQGVSKSEIIRQVLEVLHAQDANVLNSDLYPEIKYQIAKKLGVSKTLVDNNKKTVLKQIVESRSDEPIFPKEPKGMTPKAPESTPGSAAEGAGGAPFGGAAGPAVAIVGGESSEQQAETAKWTAEQVKFLFRFTFRGINKFAKDWDLLTEEEEKDIGKLLPPIFDKIFPTTADNQNYVMLGVILLSIFAPRLQKTVGPWIAAQKAKKSTGPNSGSATA